MMSKGHVYLIGAGPGHLDRLTLGAVRTIGLADAILLDDLVNPEVLQFARAGVQIMHVGKRGGCRSTPQAFIHKKMIALARPEKWWRASRVEILSYSGAAAKSCWPCSKRG